MMERCWRTAARSQRSSSGPAISTPIRIRSACRPRDSLKGATYHLRNPSEVRRLLHSRRAHVLSRRAGGQTSTSTPAASPPIGADWKFRPGQNNLDGAGGGKRRDRHPRASASARPASTATASPRSNIRATATMPSRPTGGAQGDRRRFRAGMVFAFNIDLFDPKWRTAKPAACSQRQ